MAQGLNNNKKGAGRRGQPKNMQLTAQLAALYALKHRGGLKKRMLHLLDIADNEAYKPSDRMAAETYVIDRAVGRIPQGVQLTDADGGPLPVLMMPVVQPPGSAEDKKK